MARGKPLIPSLDLLRGLRSLRLHPTHEFFQNNQGPYKNLTMNLFTNDTENFGNEYALLNIALDSLEMDITKETLEYEPGSFDVLRG